ncbi:hypothetical protein [Pseudoduganella violacea]|uniref:DUF1963 domain-containing protein n=1 Tax=Pseudoduganella violacea TaxID=1715466 RepID=A0A7W5BCU8_9BURK|nr:hypothetical protein [Pseudoduganella violacea]MBB3120867.1 hypothetical protein [Pseudoduganella violacea]
MMLPDFLRGPPQEIESLVDAILSNGYDGGTILDAALSHLTEAALDRLVHKYVATLDGDNLDENIETLIAYASLQKPAALHPFLERLFEVQPNQGSYYASWPWREAPASAIAHLADQAGAGADTEARMQAFECLLETRQSAALDLCASLAKSIPARHPMALYLESIGFSESGHALYADEPLHLIFPRKHFTPPSQSWNLPRIHPTWQLETGGSAYRFGGTGSGQCGLCGGALHHLVALPENRIGLSERPQLASLETCLSCLGMEQPVLHYRHEESGQITSLDKGEVTPEFIATPLKQCEVRLAPTPARWRWQDWALSNGRENLHRIGGFPSWVQSANHPSCPCCGEKMKFMLQLDSELPDENGEEWLWGSGGICYGFSCAPCRTTAYMWQCT